MREFEFFRAEIGGVARSSEFEEKNLEEFARVPPQTDSHTSREF